MTEGTATISPPQDHEPDLWEDEPEGAAELLPPTSPPQTAWDYLQVVYRMGMHDLLGCLRESAGSESARCPYCHADEMWAPSAGVAVCRHCGVRMTIVAVAHCVAGAPRTLDRALASGFRS